MADGLGLITLTVNLQDTFDPTQLPQMRKFTFLENIYYFFAIPFAIISEAIYFLSLPIDNNPIHDQSKPLTGRKNAALSKEISVSQLKEFGRTHGVTINDLILTVSSLSIKEYIVSKGDEKTQAITIACPVSFRAPPQKLEEVVIDNSFASVPFRLELFSDFDLGLKAISAKMKTMKTSLAVFAEYYLIHTVCLLPMFIAQPLIGIIASKQTLVFSNVPGPRSPIIVDG